MVPEAINNKSYTYANAQLSEKELVQLDAEAESDPICSSAGCNYASEKGPKTHPMNYFVPNFGRDRDIIGTDLSLAWAEKNVGHRWNWVKPPKKEPEPDFRIPDFGLDEDVIWTQESIDLVSKNMKHEWKPVQDENGVWIVPEPAENKSYSYKSLAQEPE